MIAKHEPRWRRGVLFLTLALSALSLVSGAVADSGGTLPHDGAVDRGCELARHVRFYRGRHRRGVSLNAAGTARQPYVHGNPLPWVAPGAGIQMLFSVEVCCGAEELASTMLKMREWLDSRRFEPDVFRHTVDETKITIHLQFKIEDEAIAFAETFSGQLV